VRRACAILCLGALLSACAREAAPVAWLERVRTASDTAEASLRVGDRAAARGKLLSLLESPPPAGLDEDDARSIRQDVCFRLAAIELADGKPAAALAFAERGLSFGRAEDLFGANLHIARGRALEALGADAEAAAAYHEALKINEKLLEQALPTPGEP
jgi:tetratricopeptide (TPR) repeat protein